MLNCGFGLEGTFCMILWALIVNPKIVINFQSSIPLFFLIDVTFLIFSFKQLELMTDLFIFTFKIVIKIKLSNERDSLSMTAKKLGRDLAKVIFFIFLFMFLPQLLFVSFKIAAQCSVLVAFDARKASFIYMIVKLCYILINFIFHFIIVLTADAVSCLLRTATNSALYLYLFILLLPKYSQILLELLLVYLRICTHMECLPKLLEWFMKEERRTERTEIKWNGLNCESRSTSILPLFGVRVHNFLLLIVLILLILENYFNGRDYMTCFHLVGLQCHGGPDC